MRLRGKSNPIVFDPKDSSSRSMTHQSFAKDADINTIMSRYAVSGVLVDPMNVDSGRCARFGDFSDLTDYAQLVSRINKAQEDFLTLPSLVRSRFDNSVEKCLTWISDPLNHREAVELGLLPKSMDPSTPVVDDGQPIVSAADASASIVKPSDSGKV